MTDEELMKANELPNTTGSIYGMGLRLLRWIHRKEVGGIRGVMRRAKGLNSMYVPLLAEDW